MPSPTPKSRKQSQEETRSRLLEAARLLAASDGVNAMSLRAICKAAGLTQGAFYANFKTRDDLLAALMQMQLSQEIAALEKLVTASKGQPLPETLAAIGAHFAELAADRAWHLLSVELQVHALRDPDFAQRYDATRATYLDALTGVLNALIATHNLQSIMPVRQLAASLHALWTGLSVQSRGGELPSEELLLTVFTGLATPVPSEVITPKG